MESEVLEQGVDKQFKCGRENWCCGLALEGSLGLTFLQSLHIQYELPTSASQQKLPLQQSDL